MEIRVPNFADFAPDDLEVKSFLERNFPLSRALIVPRVHDGQAGTCFANVRSFVALSGGEGITGFLILKIPGHLIEAMHHAIWRKPDGTLADVTSPAYPGLSSHTSSLIVLDGGKVGEFDPPVPSRFEALSNEPAVLDYLTLAKDRRLAYQELERTGVRQPDGSIGTLSLIHI